MTNKNIKNKKYYKELFKAFYNKRFKSARELRQFVEDLGYEIYLNDCWQPIIYKNHISLKQHINKDFLFFEKDNFIFKNPYNGILSNICNKNCITKNICREICNMIGKDYPKFDGKYSVLLENGVKEFDSKRFNSDWKVLFEDISKILEIDKV